MKLLSKFMAGACLLIMMSHSLISNNAYAKETEGNPVIFLHGYLGEFWYIAGPTYYWGGNFRDFLVNEGELADNHAVYHEWDSFSGITPDAIASLRAEIRRLEGLTNKDVNIVAHSFGGLLIRSYMRRFRGETLVNKVVTIGSPHRGTAIAHLANGVTNAVIYAGCDTLTLQAEQDCEAAAEDVETSSGATQMLPNGNFVNDLNNAIEFDQPYEFLTIASTQDGVVPFSSANGLGRATKSITCNLGLPFFNLVSDWGDITVHMNQLQAKATHRITADFLFQNILWPSSSNSRKNAINAACGVGYNADPLDYF